MELFLQEIQRLLPSGHKSIYLYVYIYMQLCFSGGIIFEKARSYRLQLQLLISDDFV